MLGMRIAPRAAGLDAFEQLERALWGNRSRNSRSPAFNVWVNDERAMLTAELPGLRKESIGVSAEQAVITIQGEISHEYEQDSKVTRRERPDGPFSRSIKLPFRVDVEKVEATYEQGVLKIIAPKHAADRARKITVNVA
jgi:HSP20 family protein